MDSCGVGGSETRYLIDLPYFVNVIPQELSRLLPECDNMWFYELLANSYLSSATGPFSPVSYAEGVITTLWELMTESKTIVSRTHERESELHSAITELERFIMSHEKEMLNHFHSLGSPDHLHEFGQVVCNRERLTAQWIFYNPEF